MPYIRVTLAARFNLRIENMTAADVMNVKCYGCGKISRIAAHQLLLKYRKYHRLKDVAANFRCLHCKRTACDWLTERAWDGIGKPPE